MDDDEKKFFKRRNPFFDLFSDFDQMNEKMDEMMKRAFEDIGKAGNKPMSYGFSIKMGPNGKPNIREFGNLEAGGPKKIKVKDAREPLVDVMEHEKEIDVLAELPGVEKDRIKVGATENVLTIEVPNEFFKELKLPAKVKEKEIKAKYKNGVLTVTLQKQKASKPKTHVKVE